MKRYLPTIALAVFCAGLFAYIMVYERAPKKQDAKQQKTTVFSFPKDDAVRVEIDNAGVVTVLEKQGVEWKISKPEPARTNQQNVGMMLFILSEFQADRLLESKAADLGKYGLLKPSVTVTVSLVSNQIYSFKVGDPTPVGQAYYVEAGEPGKVYQGAGENIRPFVSAADALRDRSIADFDWEMTAFVGVTDGNKTAECNQDKDGKWTIAGEKGGACDEPAITLLSSAATAEAHEFLPSGADPAKFGLKPPALKITLRTSDNKTIVLNIGKPASENTVAVENPQRKEIYKVMNTVEQGAAEFLKAAEKTGQK